MTQLDALALTLASEAGVAAALAPWLGAARTAAAAALMLASLATHPLAWAANDALAGLWPFAARAALIEGTVVVAEAAALAWLLRLPPRSALGLASAANAASFALGIALWAFGWA